MRESIVRHKEEKLVQQPCKGLKSTREASNRNKAEGSQKVTGQRALSSESRKEGQECRINRVRKKALMR